MIIEDDLFIENDEEGNIFELIKEECRYDDQWREENAIEWIWRGNC